MNSLLHISSVNKDERCNYIKPDNLSKFYSINPETGRTFTDKDRDILLKNYERVSNIKGGKVLKCCSRANTFENSANQDFIESVKSVYPIVRINKRLNEIVSIELSKNPNKRGVGWEPITPYIICKLSNATIQPTDDPSIKIATRLTSDCFIDNCDNVDRDITLGSILNQSQEDLKYTYFDDAKVVEAIQNNNVEAVKNYIRKYKTVDEPLSHDDRNNRLIHIACENDKDEIIDLLIGVKADLNIRNKEGNTPLHLAALKGNLNAMSSILKQGVDIKIRNLKGENALNYAIRNGDIRSVRLLYNNGVDIYSADKDGNVPIVYTIKYAPNRKDIVEFLIERGSPNKKNNDGKNALDLLNDLIEKKTKENKNKSTIGKIIEKFQVEEIKETDLTEEIMDLESTATLIRNATFSFKHGNNHTLTNIPDDYYPVDLINKECIGGEDIEGNEELEECEKKGGQLVTITEPSTRIIVGYDNKGETTLDKINSKDLYYPKNANSRIAKAIPEEIRKLNKSVRNMEITEEHAHTMTEDNEEVIKNVKEAFKNTTKVKKLVEGFNSQCSPSSTTFVIYGVTLSVLILTILFFLQKSKK